MENFTCPHCRGEIPLADVNVATDVALCRRCGKASSFSMVSGVSELSRVRLDEAAPKGIRITEALVGGRELVFRRMSKMLVFLVPFTLFWSGISLGGIYGRQIASGRFDAHSALFGLPFVIGTLALGTAILFLLFGGWRVRLDGGRGEVFAGIGSIGWTRRFGYGPDSKVALEFANVSKNNVPQKAITVRSGSGTIKFGAILPEDAKLYIAAWMAREFQAA